MGYLTKKLRKRQQQIAKTKRPLPERKNLRTAENNLISLGILCVSAGNAFCARAGREEDFE
jgi:hypothetical protein